MSERIIIPNSKVLLLRAITAATAVADGYDLGVVNGVSLILSNQLSTTLISLFVSIMPIFVGIGALIGAYAADYYGRKPVLISSYALLVLGASLMSIPNYFSVLVTGRALVGLGIGIGGVVGTVYMAEVAPSNKRGSFVAQEGLFLSCGLLLGYVSNYLLMTVENNFNVMLGIGAILPALCLITLLVVGRELPESPYWERMRGRNNIEETAPLSDSQDVEETSKQLSLSSLRETTKEFFASKGSTSALAIGILQPLCGVGPILYFSDLTFSHVETQGKDEGSIVENQPIIAMSSVFIGITKVIVLILSSLVLMDRVGRRTLLLTSSVLIMCSMIFIGSVLTWKSDNSALLLVGFCCAVGSYAVGWNVVPSVYPSEVLPTRIRTFGLSFITIVGRIISVSNAFLYPLVGLRYTNYWFFVFAFMNLISFGLVWRLAKETLNKPLIVGEKKTGTTSDSDREEIVQHVDEEAVKKFE
jgi:SP family galactose:H+ symporter-like MFS transporter